MKRTLYVSLFCAMFVLAISAATINAFEFEELKIEGSWHSDLEINDKQLKMEFSDSSFTLEMILDGEQTRWNGMYLLEHSSLMLVVNGSDNSQTQKEIPYYVIDENTIEVTVDGKTFMLERVINN